MPIVVTPPEKLLLKVLSLVPVGDSDERFVLTSSAGLVSLAVPNPLAEYAEVPSLVTVSLGTEPLPALDPVPEDGFWLATSSGSVFVELFSAPPAERFLLATSSGVVMVGVTPLDLLSDTPVLQNIHVTLDYSVPGTEEVDVAVSFNHGYMASAPLEDDTAFILQFDTLAPAIKLVNTSLAYDYFVPETILAPGFLHFDQHYFVATTAHRRLVILYKANGIVITTAKNYPFLIYGMARLAVKSLATSFAYAVKPPKVSLLSLGFSSSCRGLEAALCDVSLAYGAYNWDNLQVTLSSLLDGVGAEVVPLELSFSTFGVTQEHPHLAIPYTAEVLRNGWRVVPAAYRMGIPRDQNIFMDFSNEVRNYDSLQVSLSHTFTTGVYGVRFTLSSLIAREAHSHITLGYGRILKGSMVGVTLAFGAERLLTNGVTLKSGFSVRNGVSLVYSLQALVTSGLQLPALGTTNLRLGGVVPSELSRVFSGVVVEAPTRGLVTTGIEVPANCTSTVVSGLILPSGFFASVRSSVLVSAPINQVLHQKCLVAYDLLVRTPLTRGCVLSAPLADAPPSEITPALAINHPDLIAPVQITSASISASEGNYGWSSTFELADASDLWKFEVSDLFSYTLGSEEYVFMVESKTLDRVLGSAVATVKGMSPAISLTSPRHSLITKTWEAPITSHAVILEVAEGFPVSVTIADWVIPAYRLGVSNSSPLDVIRQVASAVGGTVDSLPDGTLRVRSLFPVSVPQWGYKTVNHQFFEDSEVFAVSDAYSPLSVTTRLRVLDAQTGQGSDRLDKEMISATEAIVRAIPSPWRESVSLVSSSVGPTISLGSVELREFTEVIEIFNGEGNTAHPIYNVLFLEWVGANLLGVIAGNDSPKVSSTHPTDKYSMLRVKYNSRSIRYDVTGVLGSEVQFLLKDM